MRPGMGFAHHGNRNDLENLEKPMVRHHARIWTRVALGFAIPAAVATSALAQSSAPHPPPPPMVVSPPAAASGTASATNPDNMPVKKPRKPTNDNIVRPPPASAAKAK